MSPIEAALFVALFVLPFHFAVQYHLARLEDPAYIRREGVVIVRESALSGHEGCLGEYQGHKIWASVTFMGMTYRFSRIAKPSYRVRRRELYLEPGLVYLTD